MCVLHLYVYCLCVYGLVRQHSLIASWAFGHHLDTQTLENHSLSKGIEKVWCVCVCVCVCALLVYVYWATPIYLLVLRAQEVGNEPFWNKNFF